MTDSKLPSFLKRIGLENNRLYQNMEEVYVPPREYDELKKSLLDKGIVIITGTKEYGKTFTAIWLLWEFYKNGYEPKYFQVRHEDKVEVRNRLSEIEAELEHKHVIYFEDPFGKLRYQSDEDIERDFGSIIDTVRYFKDSLVIITSREEIFKEFQQKSFSDIDLRQFEIRLNLQQPSYDYEKRKQMMHKYADVMKCRWFEFNELINFVETYMRNYLKLSSPLKIREFVVSTRDVYTTEELEKHLLSKSREIAMSYAEEFRNMSEDKILFLLILYVSDRFELSFVDSRYSELIYQLRINRPWPFSRVLDWFSLDKVLRIQSAIQLSHESYSEALEYILHKDGYPSDLSLRIFSPILLNLLVNNNNSSDVIECIIRNIEYLPQACIQELIKRVGMKKARMLAMNSIISKKRFHNRNSLELLSPEDKFFLYATVNGNLDANTAFDNKFSWNKVWKNVLDIEDKFHINTSENLLILISSSNLLKKIDPSYNLIFDNLVQFKLKKLIRELQFTSFRRILKGITSNSTLLDLSERFGFTLDLHLLVGILLKLAQTNLIHTFGGGKFLKSTRKLNGSVYPDKKLDVHQRIINYIVDITEGIDYGHCRQQIREKAIMISERIKKNPTIFEGKETLRVADILLLIAEQECHVPRFRSYLREATGVSLSHLSNYKNYAHKINKI